MPLIKKLKIVLGTNGYFVPFHSHKIKAMVDMKPRLRDAITAGVFQDL